jgi:hypothetical protein
MGRPINKKYFGVLAGSTAAIVNNIPVAAAGFATKVSIPGGGGGGADAGSDDIYIIKQKSARRFLVQHAEDGEQGVCKLVNKALAPDDSTQIVQGEMVIIGYFNGQAKTLRSLTNKIATDFDSVRYKWTIDSGVGDDSSATNVIILTLP